MRPFWEPAFRCFHSPAWWRRHWIRGGSVEVETADWLTGGRRERLLWCDVVAEESTEEFPVRSSRENARMPRADRGRTPGFARLAGRRPRPRRRDGVTA
ncbi:hypothetical protein ACF1AE_06155 [Streptomyces sp. NPDC014986]|uniref:hypothetical protein n=1 Tax=Streptomyces sp. NPDC014986 TaxID=3364934 RepID=UPI0036FB14C9